MANKEKSSHTHRESSAMDALWIEVDGVKYPAEIVNNVIRFKHNKIVRHLCDSGSLDLNALWACADVYSHEDIMEIYRQLGYSASGFADVFGIFNDLKWFKHMSDSLGTIYEDPEHDDEDPPA